MSFLEKIFQRREKYKIFPSEEERRDVVEICNHVVGYIHEKRIPNLVLLDRSARPTYIGVLWLWHKKFPNEQPPRIFFVNPTGFLDEDSAYQEHESVFPRIVELKSDSIKSGEDMGELEDIAGRTRAAVQEDFRATFSGLAGDRNRPLLIFDTCIHLGRTLKPVIKTLEDIGFTDLRFGVATDDGKNRSGIKPDLICLNRPSQVVCYPFHKDGLVGKTIGTITSSPTENAQMKLEALQTRRELSRIFDEAPANWYRD